MADVNLQTAGSLGSQVMDLIEYQWASDGSITGSVSDASEVGDEGRQFEDSFEGDDEMSVAMEAIEHQEEIGARDGRDQQELAVGSISGDAALASSSTEAEGQVFKSENQADPSSPLAYRFKEPETPTHPAIQHKDQPGVFNYSPTNSSPNSGALQGLPVGSAPVLQIPRGPAFTVGPSESLFKHFKNPPGRSYAKPSAGSPHDSQFGQFHAGQGGRGYGSGSEGGYNIYGAFEFQPKSEDDSLFNPETPEQREARLENRKGKNVDRGFNDEHLSHILKPNKAGNRISKLPSKGRTRNGKPQGVDNVENEMIFQLFWDRGMSFKQIADILNFSNAQSTYDTHTKTLWAGHKCNTRYNVNAPHFFKTRGIPYVAPCEWNTAKTMENGFDSSWRSNLKWVVRKFDQEKMSALVNKFEKAQDDRGHPNLAAVVHEFEGKSKWMSIKKRFNKLAQDHSNPTFGMWDPKKKCLVSCKAFHINHSQLKCIYARILNADFLNNPAVNAGNHSGIKRGFEGIRLWSKVREAAEESALGSDERMGSTEDFSHDQDDM